METVKEIIAGRLASQYEVDENGVPHGLFTSYWDNGKVKETKPFVRGRVDGVVRFYDHDGNLEETTEYSEGERHGAYCLYHNGKKLIEQQYKMGFLVRPRGVVETTTVQDIE